MVYNDTIADAKQQAHENLVTTDSYPMGKLEFFEMLKIVDGVQLNSIEPNVDRDIDVIFLPCKGDVHIMFVVEEDGNVVFDKGITVRVDGIDTTNIKKVFDEAAINVHEKLDGYNGEV